METSKRSSEALLSHEDTELRLGLPGAIDGSDKQSSQRKRSCVDSSNDESTSTTNDLSPPPPKAQVVGWPPVRSYRKNCLESKKSEQGIYVKVSMDGAPYLRKIDLKIYNCYQELLNALEKMFEFKAGTYSDNQGYLRGSEFEPAYEDKDGDWMLVGDVPFEMFVSSCKRLRIMKGSTN
ncbi:uncharacterized protein [Phyllobates terribilis]|uniref:uncharacterized protein n=1 Tax=Phyllobates terribilis TaxID=111132 RepID=UPI003CCB45F2